MMTDAHDSQTSSRLAEAQYQAASTIYGASQAAEILSAIVVFGGQHYQDAHLGLIEANAPDLVRIVARRNGNSVVAEDEIQPLDHYPAYDSLAALEYLYAPELESEPFLMPGERVTLESQGIHSILVIPMVVSQVLTGVITFTNPTPVQTPPQILRAMRNLADQIAVVFENRALLRTTKSSLEEVQTLYDINRALLAAQDPLELLRAVAETIAIDANTITHIVVNRTPSGDQAFVQHVISNKREQVVNIPLTGLPASHLLNGSPSEVVFVENIAADTTSLLYALLRDQAKSYIALITREPARSADVIVVMYREPRAFDDQTRRLFNAIADQFNIVLQNQRLLREAQTSAVQLVRQVRSLELINRIASSISSFTDEQQLLDTVTSEMHEGLNIDHVGVVLIQPDGQTGVVISEAPDRNARGSSFNMRQNPLITALLDDPSKPMIVQDVENDTLILPEVRTLLIGIGVKAVMILPLYVYGKFIGSVGFDMYETGRTFSPEVIDIARTMIAQVAIGLQNIRLLNDAQARAEQTQRLSALSQSLQTSLEIEPILRVMMGIGVDIVPTDTLTITLYDENTGLLRVIGRYQEGQATIDVQRGTLIAINDTYAGQVWSSGTVLMINDARNAPSKMGDALTGSAIIAPLRTRERRIGTITVGSTQTHTYGDTEKAIFLQVANQLAVALDNSATYARSQRVARSEALVNEVTSRFQQFSDVDELVNIAVNELGKALGARQGRIRLLTPEALADSSSGQEVP